MRITTGKDKNKALKMPKGIRPTQEKVRKAIFDILGDISGLSFLELYAGSGAVGFEAASRGVNELTLVEYNPQCLKALQKNIESLKLMACSLYPKEAEQAVQGFYQRKKKFDLIFLDPPYHEGLVKKTLQTLAAYDILSEDGFIMVQHFKKDKLPDNLGVLNLLRQYHYGDTVLSLYRK